MLRPSVPGSPSALAILAALTCLGVACGDGAQESLGAAGDGPGLPAPAEPPGAGLIEREPEAAGPEAPTIDALAAPDDEGALAVESDGDEVPRFAYHDGALARCYQGGFVAVQGDLHAHTNNSDGYHEPSDAFQYARNCGMHFFAVTDHSEGSESLDATEFAQCRSQAAAANAPGTFIAFCGFEVEPDKGHANVFFTADEWGASTRDDFATKLNNYDGQGIPAQINHPCTSVVDNQWGEFAYREAIDDNMAQMEFSGGGDFACKLAEFRYLLGQGYHLSPSNNGDLHGANYNWCAEPQHRTGLWVSSLSIDGVHDAMRQRRSFAAPHGSRIHMLSDGCWMGSVVGGVSVASFHVEAVHPPGLLAINLVGSGGTLHTCGCGGQASCTSDVELGVGAGSYVFAYADRADNGSEPLVGAPVWFRATPTCSGECAPGQTATQPCGNCGSQSRRCLGSCTWSPWSGCAGAGPCSPGQTEAGGCNDCGSTSRQCQPDCNWGAWAACQGSGVQETIGCGNCGHMAVQCGLDGVAQALTGCVDQGVCAAGTTETESCCDCGTTERICEPSCQWSSWSACAGPDPAGGTQACGTGIGGLCEPGLLRCADGCLECEPTYGGSAELCDGVDNDCNSAVDDGNPVALGTPPPPFGATLADASYPPRLTPGESALAWAEFENVGTEPWYAGELLLATDDPTKLSRLRDEEHWPAFDVAALLDQDVAPGGRAWFVFSIALDADEREPVVETLRLATISGATVPCPAAYVTLTVAPELHAHAARPPLEAPSAGATAGDCGCRVAAGSRVGPTAMWLGLCAVGARWRRRRRGALDAATTALSVCAAALGSGCGSEAATAGYQAVGGTGLGTGSVGGGGAGAGPTSSTSSGTGGQGAAAPLGGPPYAIVLAHGFFGADTWAGLDFFQYFYEVKYFLGSRGEMQVYTPAVDPFNGSDVRGAQLAAAIEEIRRLANSEKVNIIGHSQGGLDARLVAHEHPEWVASVVTVATPHQGSGVADVALGLVDDPNYLGVLDSLLDTVGRAVWDQWGEETSLGTALRSFTTEAMGEFNAAYADQPSVYYASFAGRSDRHDGGPLCAGASPDFVIDWADTLDPIDPLLAIPEMVLDGGLGAGYPNDGLVTVESARWGRFLGCLPADHIDEVGQILGDSPGFGNDWDHRQFYADVVQMLRERGL